MQNPHAFGVEPPSSRAQNPPFKSDSSCFSPLADQTAPKPNCAFCGKEAKGGHFLEIDSGYPIGQVTGTVEFSCGCDGRTIFSLSADNIAQWQLFGQVRPGVFRVKKLTKAQRVKELNAGS